MQEVRKHRSTNRDFATTTPSTRRDLRIYYYHRVPTATLPHDYDHPHFHYPSGTTVQSAYSSQCRVPVHRRVALERYGGDRGLVRALARSDRFCVSPIHMLDHAYSPCMHIRNTRHWSGGNFHWTVDFYADDDTTGEAWKPLGVAHVLGDGTVQPFFNLRTAVRTVSLPDNPGILDIDRRFLQRYERFTGLVWMPW